MFKTPSDSIYLLSNGKKISLSREFFFQSSEEFTQDLNIVHLGTNGRLLIHEMPSMPYKLAFVDRSPEFESSKDELMIIHIAEFIPAIIKHLPKKSLTNICLFLFANTALIFVARLHEILSVKLKIYTSPDDLLYHVIHMLEVNKLNKDSIDLCLTGEIAADSAIMLNFSRYFKQVSLIPLAIDIL